MRKLMLFALLNCSLPIFALAEDHNHGTEITILEKSPVTLATLTALKIFEQLPNVSLWGFKSLKLDDEAGVRVLYTDSESKAHFSDFDCHFHAHPLELEAHCHAIADQITAQNPPTLLQFKTDDFISGLASASNVFERKIAPLAALTYVKMWQIQSEMHITLGHSAGAGEGASHFMCHTHGASIDCHRSRVSGPSEPQF